MNVENIASIDTRGLRRSTTESTYRHRIGDVECVGDKNNNLNTFHSWLNNHFDFKEPTILPECTEVSTPPLLNLFHPSQANSDHELQSPIQWESAAVECPSASDFHTLLSRETAKWDEHNSEFMQNHSIASSTTLTPTHFTSTPPPLPMDNSYHMMLKDDIDDSNSDSENDNAQLSSQSPHPRQCSSRHPVMLKKASPEEVIEKRLKRRRERNRLAARKSRERRVDYIKELEDRIELYRNENCALKMRLNSIDADYQRKYVMFSSSGSSHAAATSTTTSSPQNVAIKCLPDAQHDLRHETYSKHAFEYPVPFPQSPDNFP